MKAVLLLALVAVALAQINPAATFCGKWTGVLFGGNNTAANQRLTIATVVDRTILGCVSGLGGCVATSLGLLQLPLNARYFNGSGYIPTLPNYIDPNTPQPLIDLKNKLINFFSFALGCTVYLATLSPPYIPGSLYQTHSPLRIDTATFNEFIGNGQNGLTGALAASGVPLTDAIPAQSELNYLSALVGTMGVTGQTCNGAAGINDPCFLSVCSDPAACFAASGFAQLVNVGTTAWGNGLDPTQTSQNVQIPVGGAVNWRFGPVHNIRQTDSDGGSDYTTNGFGVSLPVGPTKFTYTHTFAAAGTYFFRCEVHQAMHGFVAVGSGVAGLTASLSVLAAAIVAAKALML